MDETTLFDTSKHNHSRSLNDLHEPHLKYVFLFNYSTLRKALETAMSCKELVDFAIKRLEAYFDAEIIATDVKVLYICNKNYNIKNQCILDDSLTNIVNHHIEIHHGSVSCSICHKHLKTVCDIQRHAMVFTDKKNKDWKVYKEFFMSLYDLNRREPYKDHDFSNELFFEECYTLPEFEHRFSNEECRDIKCKYSCNLYFNNNAAIEEDSRIVDALNKNIQQLRTELQQALTVSNERRMESIDDRANELLANAIANRGGTFDLNFNDYGSSESLLENSYHSDNHHSDSISIGSVYENGDSGYPTPHGFFSDSDIYSREYLANHHTDSMETLQYYMASQSTLLEDAEFEARYANSETSTISVFEGYQLDNEIDTLDEWDAYVQDFLRS